MYALNSPLSPNDILGVSGADNMCYRQAREAKVPGIFRAVLTTRLQTIESLVFYKDRDLAIANGNVSIPPPIISSPESMPTPSHGVLNNCREKGYWNHGLA